MLEQHCSDYHLLAMESPRFGLLQLPLEHQTDRNRKINQELQLNTNESSENCIECRGSQ